MYDLPENWTSKNYQEFVGYLISIKEEEYAAFNRKLIPVCNYEILGIRNPVLRKIAKEIGKTDIYQFLKFVENKYYEEVMIEGLVISNIKELDKYVMYLEKFLPKIDNWAICDTCISTNNLIKNNKKFFFEKAKQYLKENHEYTVRSGLNILMSSYLDEEYMDEVFLLIDDINREEYYINMCIAWLVSVCFVKDRDKTLSYLQHNKLNKFTQNKSISKIRDSYRVTKEDKDLILKFKK